MVHVLHTFHCRLSTRDGGEGSHTRLALDLRRWHAPVMQISGTLVHNPTSGLSCQFQAALDPFQALVKPVRGQLLLCVSRRQMTKVLDD